MLHSRQILLIKRIFAHIDAGTTDQSASVGLNPVSNYFSLEHQTLEKERLFNHRATVVGLSGLLPAVGDYIVEDLNGTSILLVRTESGEINGFLNFCRHRGAQLVHGRGGSATKFVCPYHAWSYNLEGVPHALTPRKQYDNLNPYDRRLTKVPVTEAHGLIWVHPVADIKEPIDLQDLGSEFDTYKLQEFTHYETRRLSKRMNWKLFVDTFLENAHFSSLHGETIAPSFIPGVGVLEEFGENFMLIYPRHTVHKLREQPEEKWSLLKHSLVIYGLFPNVLLLWQRDHVELWRVFPDPHGDPTQCVGELSLYSPVPTDNPKLQKLWQQNIELAMRTVDDEDFPVAEGVQRGLVSGAQSHITFGRHEPALIYFHEQLKKALLPRI